MIGITLTTDQIRNAPTEVRQWIEHEVLTSLSLVAHAPSMPPRAAHLVACSEEEVAAIFAKLRVMLPVLSVLFELGRPGITFGAPPVKSFGLMDVLHNTKLQSIEQVMSGLEAINEALVELRGDPTARFCDFDNEGHCFLAPETQASVAALWQDLVAGQQMAAEARPEPASALRAAG
jgi:hypothetical protein